MIALRVHIRGRVQGVGYRAWTVREANMRNLSGWVRNRADGSVEAVFEGEDATVKAMVGACRRGPRMAAVSSVETTSEQPGNRFGFEVLATA